ncbi:MAG: hypothetical protein GWN58_02450, partial [Anaerolineae bacterium]|nr:hypothetical protein [Anaerolineae bacterium]
MVAAAVVGLSLLLLVDSRSALVFIPISLGVLVLLRGARRPKVAWSAFPPLLLPFALAAVVLAVPNGLIATFKLGDAPTVRQLSERTEIWKRSLDELAQFKWQH